MAFISVLMSDDTIETMNKVFALKAQEFIACGDDRLNAYVLVELV